MAAAVIGAVAVLPAVVLALPFVFVAWLSRLLLRVLPLQHSWVPWDQLIEFEPEVGWRPKANLDAYARGDEVFRITTDAHGWRGNVTLAESDVVVFGDSFAFGHGIDDDGFFGGLLDRPKVKPIACDGYSMVHPVLWMERLRDELAGKLVVWFVYLGNDLYESLVPNLGPYRMPFLRWNRDNDGWEVVTDHVSPDPWPMPEGRAYTEVLAQVCTPGPLTRRIFSAADHLIGMAEEICSSAGARLVLVSVPSSAQYRKVGKMRRLSPRPELFDPELPDRELAAACVARGIGFVALRHHLEDRDYLSRDIHWTPSGHRKAAALIRELWLDSVGDTAAPGASRSR